MTCHLSPLTTAIAVVQSQTVFQGHDTSDIAGCISDFIDLTRTKSFFSAIEVGSLRLMRRWRTVHMAPIRFKDWCQALSTVSSTGNLDLVEWVRQLLPDQCVPKDAWLEAARGGHLVCVQYYYTKRPEAFSFDALDSAASSGNLELFWWMMQEGIGRGVIRNAAALASAGGRLEVVKWLYENHFEGRTGYAVNAAVSHGQLHVLDWFLEHTNVGFHSFSLYAAASKGYLDIVITLYKNLDRLYSYPTHLDSRVAVAASTEGHLSVLQWLFMHRDVHKWPKQCYYNAANRGDMVLIDWFGRHMNRSDEDNQQIAYGSAYGGHFYILKWILECHPDLAYIPNFGTGILDSAASEHRIDIMHWAVNELNAQPTESILLKIVDTGTLTTLQYFLDHFDVPVTTQAVYRAISTGNLDKVKLLAAYTTTAFTPKAMNIAAANGFLTIIKYLHENRREGCTTDAMDVASQAGYLPVVQFLHENRSEGCTTFAMDWASKKGDLNVVRYLHANRSEGCTTNAIDKAAANGHFAVVQWLHHNRSEGCTVDAMNSAAKSGFLDIVKFLHYNRSEGCTTQAMDDAGENGHLHVVEWLHEHRHEGFSAAQPSAEMQEVFPTVAQWFEQHQRAQA